MAALSLKRTLSFSNLSKQFVGWIAVFLSLFFFYLATVIIRWAEHFVEIEPPFFVFGRLLLGLLIVSSTLYLKKQRLKPVNFHFLIGRAVFNTIAVFCFYKAVEAGTVSEANILNMTYPLFVALFTWCFIKDQRDFISLLILAVAFIGIWLVLAPGISGINWNNTWGLASGITAAAAILYLNISRKFHDSQTILFYMFGIGTTLMAVFFHHTFFIPNSTEAFFLITCSLAGVLGQYLLTYGFLYVTAVEGSIISSGRILLAALLGPFLVAEPSLTLTGWCGAIIIFGANSALAARKYN